MPYKDKEKQRQAQHEHYLNNLDKYKNSRRKNRNERDVWFLDLKKQKQCVKCGEEDHRCLEFHHKKPNTKSFSITDAVRFGLSEEKILNEIKKCDPLCANCHRIEHYVTYHSHTRGRTNAAAVWVREFKKTQKCLQCGMKDNRCLDFHHKDHTTKIKSISKMVGNGTSIDKIKLEIEKCDPLCANCHRIEHNGNKWENDSLVK